MSERKRTISTVETAVLVKSRRRCCICYGLERSDKLVRGQIAHLDQDPSNSSEDNLAFVCLDHHDIFDGKTSQSKNITIHEAKLFRRELHEAMAAAFSYVGESDVFAGDYVRVDSGSDSAEIVLTRLQSAIKSGEHRYYVSGYAVSASDSFPELGELEFIAEVEFHEDADPALWHYHKRGPDLSATRIIFREGNAISVVENFSVQIYPGNVSFSGVYLKVSSRLCA